MYYYHLDQLNTPRFVTNNKAEVVWENQADVYGYEELKAESNKEDSFTQPIRFQGQYLDEESGLHYNRYRYYSPKQQRFINQDPIGLVGGINHYQYAPNPVNWVDPFGLRCKEDEERRLKVCLKKAFNEGLISEELQRDLLEAAQIGFITVKEIKQEIISGNPASLLILGGGDNSSPMTSQSIIDESIGEPLSIDALINSELDKVTSLIWKEGEEFKNHVLINYHLDPDMQVLTRDEFLSLAVYTTNLYKPINAGLRGFSPKDKEKWAKAVADTDQALIKLAENPLLRYEGHVIRGDQFSDDLLEELFPVGGIHYEKGFKSSSSNLDKPFDGNTKILITSKTGVNIANNAAVKPEEQEVLFKSGTKFKVISRLKVNGTNFIELEEV